MLPDERDIARRVIQVFPERIVHRTHAGFLIREERSNWLHCFVCAHTGRVFRTPSGRPASRPDALTVQQGTVFDL